ncbi:hypothetical protein [Pseudonocardia sp.]|uniref:hypothetical protein n=1 Tax=Pseudonocardia sp. TaxID=60912 RepID=UPI003D0E1F5D
MSAHPGTADRIVEPEPIRGESAPLPVHGRVVDGIERRCPCVALPLRRGRTDRA